MNSSTTSSAQTHSLEIGIKIEIPVMLQVVDIIVHDLERNIGGAHGIHDLSRFLHTRIAPSGQLETKAPERHRLHLSHDLRVLLVHVNRSRTGDKVEVERSTDYTVLEHTGTHENVHSVGVEKEDSV